MNADPPPLRPAADPGQPPAKVQGPYTETDLYLAVTRGWCELPSRQARREHPIGGYIFGWRFVASVERTPVPVPIVAWAILKVVCRRNSPNDGAVSLSLSAERRSPFDAVAAWWWPFDEIDDLGIHYVELRAGSGDPDGRGKGRAARSGGLSMTIHKGTPQLTAQARTD
jgi:hypothetical protein